MSLKRDLWGLGKISLRPCSVEGVGIQLYRLDSSVPKGVFFLAKLMSGFSSEPPTRGLL